MDNPFKNLQDDRLSAEAMMEKKSIRANQYEEMVKRVLENLKVAVYPSLDVWKDYATLGCWVIGEYVTYRVGDDDIFGRGQHKRELFSKIIVTLEFNEFGDPIGFICEQKYGPKSKCGLSENDLIIALQSLHPPGWNKK